MAKFCGVIGYGSNEKENGVVKIIFTERKYVGDFEKNTRTLEPSGSLNDNINIANRISIVADPYANKNYHSMKYVEFMGAKWKITSVEVQFPRLILTIGGEYNS